MEKSLTTKASSWLSGNDMFSELKGNELLTLLSQIEDTPLTYRESINVPELATFGYEIEYEGIKRDLVTYLVSSSSDLKSWESGSDSTVSGGEIRSPILRDNKEYWEQLQKICRFLQKFKATTNGKCVGGHFHIGVQTIGSNVDAWKDFVLLYSLYENVLFRFFYGDKFNGREGIGEYAPPIGHIILSKLKYIMEYQEAGPIIRALQLGKYSAVNFGYVSDLEKELEKNTIEFRAPNSSTNEIILQNNVNAPLKMLTSAREGQIDRDFLMYRLKKEKGIVPSDYETFNAIYLKDALEFVDLTFDNNLDKVYFLKQYFKGFKEVLFTKGLVEAPSLRKK